MDGTTPRYASHSNANHMTSLPLFGPDLIVPPTTDFKGAWNLLPDAHPDIDTRWGTKPVVGSSQVLPMSAINRAKGAPICNTGNSQARRVN